MSKTQYARKYYKCDKKKVALRGERKDVGQRGKS